MKPLKIGITGVRGIVGETFTPELAVRLASAFATYMGEGRICLCEDARPSGKMVRSAVISALIASGCEPVDLGICPAPAMQFEIRHSGAAGGIVISAGHNPEEWNALRFVRSDGMYFNELQGEEILDIYHQGEFHKADWESLKPLRTDRNAKKRHIDAVLAAVDTKRIKKAGLRVALDTCNGACCREAKALLDALGCSRAALNDDPGEPFPHDPEPNEYNMRPLAAVVAATGFDAGFMFDTAGERLALVADGGRPLSEEQTIALCADFALEKHRGPIVTNVCTTRALDDLAKKYKVKIIRTSVGQGYVAETAMKFGAAAAGEGSGGVVVPRVHYAFDALATMAFVLDGLARRKSSLSAAAAALPKYFMLKDKVELDYTAIYRVIRKARRFLRKTSGATRLDMTDGMKMEWDSSWLHIRPSNTESMVRIIAEARTERRARELLETGREIIEK